MYGVPFEVEGVVKDLYYEDTYVRTSLDAHMVFGDAALALLEAGDDYPIYNPAYLAGESDTQTYTPYTPFADLWPVIANADAFADAKVEARYYMVSRIDGSSATAALALVDRTAIAEELAQSGALDGIVYVDGRYGDEPPDTDYTGSYEAGEWNMWGTRYLFEDLGWYDVVWDGNDEEFGTAPAPDEVSGRALLRGLVLVRSLQRLLRVGARCDRRSSRLGERRRRARRHELDAPGARRGHHGDVRRRRGAVRRGHARVRSALPGDSRWGRRSARPRTRARYSRSG